MAESRSPTKKLNANLKEIERLDRRFDHVLSRIEEVEKKVEMLVQFYEDNVVDGSSEEVQPKGMPYFMQKFRKILCQIMNHKSAFPFLKLVDPVALGQDEVIRKPMDLGTILTWMDLNEENCRYKNIYDICADVRLVFTTAMLYNDLGSNLHTMAHELSYEFEKLWFPLGLEVAHEEWIKHMHQGDGMEEDTYEKLGEDLDVEQMLLIMELQEVWEELTKSSCRELSTEEKGMLKDSIGMLSVEDLSKAVKLATKYDPDWNVPSDIADIDLNSMAVIAQWMLYKFFEMCQTEVESTSNGKNMQSS